MRFTASSAVSTTIGTIVIPATSAILGLVAGGTSKKMNRGLVWHWFGNSGASSQLWFTDHRTGQHLHPFHLGFCWGFVWIKIQPLLQHLKTLSSNFMFFASVTYILHLNDSIVFKIMYNPSLPLLKNKICVQKVWKARVSD